MNFQTGVQVPQSDSHIYMLGNEYDSTQTALMSALCPTASYQFRMFVLIAHASPGVAIHARSSDPLESTSVGVNPLDTIQCQGTLQITWLEHSVFSQHIPFFPLFSFPFFSLSIHSDSTFHYSILQTQVLHKPRSLPMFVGMTEDMPISRSCQAWSHAFQVR